MPQLAIRRFMRLTRLKPLIVFSLLAALAGGLPRAAGLGGDEAKAPSVQLVDAGQGRFAFELTNISAADVGDTTSRSAVDRTWAERFAIYVLIADKQADQPAVFGSYKPIAGGVRFTPRFPLQPGLRYRAVYRAPDGAATTEDFQAPPPRAAPATEVAIVYPTASTLPENQLKFYLHFTAPMGRGEAYDHLRLLDETGRDLDLPFLEVGEELWDPSGKRLTLLLDPARVKRGLKPREEQGPVLTAGRSYTLAIDRRWRDATCRPLRADFRKHFSVGPADEQSPDPRRWQLAPPAAGSRGPLVVRFGEPLDQALLERMLWVVDADGQRLPGEMIIGERETSWSFAPERRWQAGKYQLVADTLLEDLAGNSIAGKFEVERTRPAPTRNESKQATIEFIVSARQK